MKVHNFSAGPAILPQSVLAEAAASAKEFNGLGLSILEISHRSQPFVDVLEEAVGHVRNLYNLSDDYEVLFLTGGASSQFYMVPMNLLGSNDTAGYVDTGTWSAKAIKEVRNFGNVEVIASSKEDNYSHVPKGYGIAESLKYLHLTSNNTIFGTQYHDLPKTDVPLVVDMSSDIFSRPVDISKYGMIYAGAQKNLGPAGTTLAIVRKDLLGKVDRDIPTMLDYRTHIKKNSSFNTPPVYPIYVCMLTMRWIVAQGGLEKMAARNAKKAALLYDAIDAHPLFEGTAKLEDRSLMNVTFVMKEKEREADFMKLCTENGISGIKGHRSVGGFRASIYNAMPTESIEFLVELMNGFK